MKTDREIELERLLNEALRYVRNAKFWSTGSFQQRRAEVAAADALMIEIEKALGQ